MLPAAFLSRMERLLGDEYADFLRAYDRPLQKGLRLGRKAEGHSLSLPFGLRPVPWAENGFTYDPETRTVYLTELASLSADDAVWSDDAGERAADTNRARDVHGTIVFGRDAYGVVDVEGKGAVQIIVKPHGSSGTADPLDQRATVGAKVTAYTAAILNDLWLVRIEHTVS